MDFEGLVTKLDTLQYEELLQMLSSLENLLAKTKDCLEAKCKPKVTPNVTAQISTVKDHVTTHGNTVTTVPEVTPVPKSAEPEMFQFHKHPLDDKLVTGVHKYLKTLKFHRNRTSTDSPATLLFGTQKYVYNGHSAKVDPVPISPGSVMGDLLDSVNSKLGCSFDSILINKYRDLNCSLAPHKDDEPCVDMSSPIATLSLGSTRRFLISPNSDKYTPIHTVFLTPRSIVSMLPGFQEKYYHSIALGRGSIQRERGMRHQV